jgi:hypothetical protein
MRRRVLHVPDSGKIGRARRAGLVAVLTIVVLALAGSVAAAVMLTVRSSAAGSGNHRPTVRPSRPPVQAAAAAAALANGKAAATWVAGQVGQGPVIGCDPAMCAAILAAGYPTGPQVILQQGVILPGPGSLIVATPAVRAQYGPQLASHAPAVIATFGSGASAVQVRLAVAGGPQVYSQEARHALAVRRRAGHKLLRDLNVQARGVARKDLSSGLVDPRLTTVLRRLAVDYPILVVRFGGAGPLAGGAVPFRMVEVALLPTPAGDQMVSELAAVEKLLRRQSARDRAELMPVHMVQGKRVHGKAVLELTVRAPSPL